MTYFVYLNEGGYIVSEFADETDADNLITANDDGVMSKVAAPSDSNSVKYLKYVNDDFIAETQQDINDESFINLRAERNTLLAASDWTQASDSPLSDGKKIEWASYRQILRDLPANTSDPSNASYPDKPE